MTIFTGSGAAVCTPFDSTGAFNEGTYEKLIDFLVEKGTDAIVSCGSTGEASTLDTEEHIAVVRAAVAATKKAGDKYGRKVPVLAGAGGNDTAYDMNLAKKLQEAGVDALMCATPYYNKTSQRGLVVHYGKIAAAVDLPIIVYNVPARTGLNIKATTMPQLAKIPNIVGIKEASGNIVQIAEMIEYCGDSIDMYAGNDDYVLPVLALGGKGVISTTANIAPADMHNLVASFMDGDVEKSRQLQLGLLPLVRMMFADINPMPVKAALNLMGFDVGPCRLPLIDIDADLMQALKQELTRYGLT